MQECCTGKRDLIHISLSHSELIYFNNKAQLRANLYSSLTLALALSSPPPSIRGCDRAEGAGLPQGPGRAELHQIRAWGGSRTRLGPLLLLGAAGREGQHDGPEPAQQPGDLRGPLLHQPAQSHDRPGPLQPALCRPHGRR